MASEKIYDVLGIGFGPANLAIATAFAEHNVAAQRNDAPGGRRSMSVGFVESHPEFRWHPGMMIPGSRMQISFLKDLATLRNPSSPYTFLNYLAFQNRLVTFINLSTFTPTRREFADYMAWVASQVVDNSCATLSVPTGVEVHYGEWVDHVEAVVDPTGESDTKLLRVWSSSTDGRQTGRLCRNLIASTGEASSPSLGTTKQSKQAIRRPTSKPVSPIASPGSDKSSHFAVDQLVPTSSAKPIRIAIIGGGQSAAETFLETRSRLAAILENLPGSITARPRIDLIIRRGNLHPSDDSPFSNEIFDPAATDFYYNLGDESVAPDHPDGVSSGRTRRQVVLDEALATNYAVVNPNTLETVYRAIYDQRVEEDIEVSSHPDNPTPDFALLANDPKLRIINHTEVSSVSTPESSQGNGITLDLRNVLTGQHVPSYYDIVILGTGYSRQSWRDILFGSEGAALGLDGMKLREVFGRGPESAAVSNQGDASSESSASSLSIAASLLSLDDVHAPETPMTSVSSSQVSLGEKPRNASPASASTKPLALFGVARNYRLNLPKSFRVKEGGAEVKFRPTVWLQGSNEASHGISDSLLSVLSVRSGEVLAGIEEEGWFGEAR